MIRIREFAFVRRHDDANSTAIAIWLSKDETLTKYGRRSVAFLLERLFDLVSRAIGFRVDIRYGVEAVHGLVVTIVALRYIVVQRDGSHDERRAPRHAHNRAQHAAPVVHAIVHDGLDEQR